ncbi:hypothetical protein CKJ89_39120, partial [Klebsiella pneumoniae]
GPASDSVVLGFNQNVDGSYTPDYPRLFPTLDSRRINTLSLHMPQMLKVITSQKVFSSTYFPKILVIPGRN